MKESDDYSDADLEYLAERDEERTKRWSDSVEPPDPLENTTNPAKEIYNGNS